MKHVHPWLWKVLYLALGLFLGFCIAKYQLTTAVLSQAARGQLQRSGQEGLINPLISCEVVNKLNVQEFKPFEEKIKKIVTEEIGNNNADHVSVYFRALNSGRWFGINEDEPYIGASLIKLPIALAYYHLTENGPASLDHTIVNDIDPTTVTAQNIQPSKTINPKQQYTIRDLISYMLVSSDNAAMTLLTRHIAQADIDSIFSDIGIERKLDAQSNVEISPKLYSSFLRLLYNATFLSQHNSAELLSLLTQTEYKDGLVGGVPSDVQVAHKFGERTETNQIGDVVNAEFHDCGIVYFPEHPYILCVMTRGKNSGSLQRVIRRISETMYTDWTEYWKHPQF